MSELDPSVNIVLSDRNWILEQLGRELESRISNVFLSDQARDDVAINYYITYGCRRQSAPTLEMALFTHMEQDSVSKSKFIQTAREIDLSVCMSEPYIKILREHGVEDLRLISPGVDLEKYNVKLRVGVVGRTYHTGRKGEALIQEVLDLPGIDWHFTGSGWPLPGRHLDAEELPDFYRSMDYILVPALYEGGPMCVLEALAVGTPVIGSDVGWVKEFPHHEFETGNVEDLKRILVTLRDKKVELRDTVAHMTWDNYADEHRKAFLSLYSRLDSDTLAVADKVVSPPAKSRIGLLLHGNEGTTLGGPSVRVPRTAASLQKIGVQAQFQNYSGSFEAQYDIVHIFNVWNPASALRTIIDAKSAGMRVVFSPIFLDLSERSFWADGIIRHFDDDPVGIDEEELSVLYSQAQEYFSIRGYSSEPIPGYNAIVRYMIDLSDHVILLSRAEKTALENIGVDFAGKAHSFVKNPVDHEVWSQGDSSQFREQYGDEDYAVCVGRIEERKNQLLLAQAFADLPLQLYLIGHIGSQKISDRIEALDLPNVHMLGRFDPGSGLLKSAIKGARAFILPSWSEGAPLAALEAGAAGAQLVLSTKSSEEEYFGDLAHYCDPACVASIREAVTAAISDARGKSRKQKLAKLMSLEHSWEKYAADTAQAYASVEAQKHDVLREPEHWYTDVMDVKTIYLDVTTTAHHVGRITGISRVENELIKQFDSGDSNVEFICWNDSLQQFILVPDEYVEQSVLSKYLSQYNDSKTNPQVTLPPGSAILVAGSAWMQNSRYVSGLSELKDRSCCSLSVLVYDIIPVMYPHWFEKGYAQKYTLNLRNLLRISDQIFTDSVSCKTDVQNELQSLDAPVAEITPVRLGDTVLAGAPAEVSGEGKSNSGIDDLFTELGNRKFALCVGAVHTRKNYDMLYRIWARFADEGTNSELFLVIVGGVAWNGGALAETIRNDPRVANKIRIVTDASDSKLKWLYDNCVFTLFPSLYEGWGLPVAESLANGKVCIASSSSSITEIAPELVDHIDPEDFISWKTKIEFYARSKVARELKERKIREDYTVTTWESTAASLYQRLKQRTPTKGKRRYYFGEVINANNRDEATNVIWKSGWHAAEGWGRWARSDQAGLEIYIGRDVVEDCILTTRFQLHFNSQEPRLLQIIVNDKIMDSRLVHRMSSIREFMTVIPAAQLDASGKLDVDYRLRALPEAASKESRNVRNLGFGLQSVVVSGVDVAQQLNVLKQPEHWMRKDGQLKIDMSNEDHRLITANCDLQYSTSWGAHTLIGKIVLWVPLLPVAEDLSLVLLVRAVATSADPCSYTISVNQELIASGMLHDDQLTRIVTTVPGKVWGTQAPFVLTLNSKPKLCPRSAGLGESDSVAGIGLHEVLIGPVSHGGTSENV